MGAEARKAKQAAVAAARRGRTFTEGTNPRSERTVSDSTPRWADMADQCFFADEHESIPNDDRTTLMFRNLPNNYNRSTLLQMLDSEDAKKAKSSFQGFARWRVPSRKTCDVVWSGPVQGLQAHTERYRNSPVMHDSVPDEYKPAVFVDGIRVAFPAPTKRIRPPRVRRNSAGDGAGIAAPVPDAFTQAKRSGRGKNL